MAKFNIVKGIVRGAFKAMFGDPYNNQTYLKALGGVSRQKLSGGTLLAIALGRVSGVAMSTFNSLKQEYAASNCTTLKNMNFWAAVNEDFDAKNSTVRDLYKMADNAAGLTITNVEGVNNSQSEISLPQNSKSISGNSSLGFPVAAVEDNAELPNKIRVRLTNRTSVKANRSYALVLFAFSPDGHIIGTTYSCDNNAIYNEDKGRFEVPKEIRKKWQKASGGLFAWDKEVETTITLNQPMMEGMFVVAYAMEINSYTCKFHEGTQVEYLNNGIYFIG